MSPVDFNLVSWHSEGMNILPHLDSLPDRVLMQFYIRIRVCCYDFLFKEHLNVNMTWWLKIGDCVEF